MYNYTKFFVVDKLDLKTYKATAEAAVNCLFFFLNAPLLLFLHK